MLVLLLCPFPFVRSLLSMSVLERQAWNQEFGSPPSTLPCHLSLKNEYEENYTATSVRGSKKVCKEEEAGDMGRNRHSESAEAPGAPGAPGRVEGAS